MRAKILTVVLSAGLVGIVSVSPEAQTPQPPTRKLEITFDGAGNVALVAQGVSIQEILAEWTRRGGSTVDGAARLPATPVTFAFQAQPEVRVLESLLRSASGLILMPRLVGAPGASRLDVRILPTSTPQQMFSSAGSGVMTPPVTTVGSPNDEVPPVTPMPVANQPGQATPPPQNAPRPGGLSAPVPVVPIAPITPVTPGQTGRGGGGGIR